MTDPVTRIEVEQIVDRAVCKAIHTTFALFGVDTKNQDSINEFRADLVSARQIRKTRDTLRGRIMLTIFTILTTGLIMAFWDGIKAKWGG